MDISSKVIPEKDLGWLSGIIDGEGCLAIVRKRDYYTPAFQISLRYDDLGALFRVRSMFGGCGKIHAKKPARADLASVCTYRVGGISDLIENVCPVLDTCFLHTKKGLEYPLWKEFIYLFFNKKEERASRRMAQIRREIHRIRHMQCLGFIPKEVVDLVDTHDEVFPFEALVRD